MIKRRMRVVTRTRSDYVSGDGPGTFGMTRMSGGELGELERGELPGTALAGERLQGRERF